MTSKVARALLTSGAALAVIVGFAVPAGATTCASGGSCTWKDSNYSTGGNTSKRIQFMQHIPTLHQWAYSTAGGSPCVQGTSGCDGADSASSMHNNGTMYTVNYYVDTHCSGPWFARGIGQMDGDFSNSTPGYNGSTANGQFQDKLSSGAFTLYVSYC